MPKRRAAMSPSASASSRWCRGPARLPPTWSRPRTARSMPRSGAAATASTPMFRHWSALRSLRHGPSTRRRRWWLSARTSAALGLLRRRPDHGFELHAVGIGKIDRVIAVTVILARRIDHRHAVLFEKSAEIVHRLAAGQLEGVVMETDIAFAIFVLPALRIGGGNPEQRLAVAPAGHVAVFVFQFEAEKF